MPKTMNKRDESILAWTNKNRPDLAEAIENTLLMRGGPPSVLENINLLLAIGFEAGRQFQKDNPGLEMDNPNVYLRFET